MTNPVDTYLNTQMQSAQSSTNNSSVVTGVGTGVATASLLAASGYAIYCVYKLMTERPALSNEDLKRYRTMVTAYKKMGYDTFSRWELEGKKTTYCMNYSEVINSLDNTIHQLLAGISASGFARANILSLIRRYIESIDKRNWYFDKITDAFDRPDGVEALFLTEMIAWLQMVVPNTSELTIVDDFEKRILYCKEVLVKIAKNRAHNQHRANFKDFLERLIQEFKAYHVHLIQRHETENFNQLINKLSDCLLSLSIQSFHTLHLLINEVNQPYLIVKQFIHPYESDQKIIALKKKKLGQWLLKTLSLIGIEDSMFESRNTITLDDIKEHLAGEIPGDPNFRLESRPNDAISDAWGHWAFVTSAPKSKQEKLQSTMFQRDPEKEKLRKKAINYLVYIRELLRLTLLFYFIRQNLLRTATVASVFGEIWIYGDKTGKAVLDELLNVVLEIIKEYSTTFNTFWQDYFENNYISYEKLTHEDDFKHPCHNWLHQIDQVNKINMGKIINYMEEVIVKIQAQALKLPETLKAVKQIKVDLFEDLLALLSFTNRTETTNYHTINNGLKVIKNKDGSATDNLSSINTKDNEESSLFENHLYLQKIKSNSKEKFSIKLESLIDRLVDAEVKYKMSLFHENQSEEKEIINLNDTSSAPPSHLNLERKKNIAIFLEDELNNIFGHIGEKNNEDVTENIDFEKEREDFIQALDERLLFYKTSNNAGAPIKMDLSSGVKKDV